MGGEQAALGRVERVCGDLRRTGATFTGLDPGRYLADLDAPALPGEGGPWWEKASASALPETDRLPTVCSASRRLFARMFDEMLVRVLIASGLCLAGINLAAVSSFVVSLTAVVLLAFVEPLFLRLWGTTPGKALLGMRLTGPDGKNVPYTEGLARYFLMMWYGQGFEIPVWSLIQGYRSVRRCWDDEPQPWDVEVAYIAKPFRARYGVGLVLATLLVLTAGEAANSWSQTPPNRGDVTVAEFAENYNRQADYLGFGGRTYLDETGQWQEEPGNPNAVTVGDFGIEPWPEARGAPLHLGGRPHHGHHADGDHRECGGGGGHPQWPGAAHRHVPGLGAGGGLLLVPRPAGPDDGAGAARLVQGLCDPSAGGGHHIGHPTVRTLLSCKFFL